MLRESFELAYPNKSVSLKSILVWSFAALFTIFQLLLEMLTNTMTDPLMNSFNVSHGQLGLLSSAFFYTFLAMQLPAGIILDRFNIKWVLSVTCAGCGLGCLLFGYSSNFIFACIARSIMGAFAAFGFLGLLKVSAMWYPARIFPFLIGFSQFLVMLVTAFSESLTLHNVASYGWRIVLISAGYIGLAISLLIILFVEERVKSRTELNNKPNLIAGFSALISNKKCWLASFYGFGMFSIIAAFSAFSALWGLSYLTVLYHLQPQEAAFALSINFIGIACGCALLGLLSCYLNNYLIILRACSLASLLLIFLLMFATSLTAPQLNFILFFLGIFCSSYFLCFDIVKKCIDKKSEGIAIAFCNIFVMSGTILLQPLMGFLIDFNKIFFRNLSQDNGYRLSIAALAFTVTISFITSNFINKINLAAHSDG